MSLKPLSLLTLATFVFTSHAHAQDIPFTPCPLLGPRFPIPTHLSTSRIIQSGLHNLTSAFDNYVTTLNGTFGPTSATTSFSVILFSTENTNASDPFLFEYHHTAKSLSNKTSGAKTVDRDTIYPIGDLTTLFTTWLFLIEAGDPHWADPITAWIPELRHNSTASTAVKWEDITLGDLAGHLSGLGNFHDPLSVDPTLASMVSNGADSTAGVPCHASTPCTRESFLSFVRTKSPVVAPGSTPILSNTAFILLAYALESMTKKSYASLLQDSILTPLNLTRTTLLTSSPHQNSFAPAPPPSPYSTLTAPYSGLLSTPHNLAHSLRSLLSSTLLPPATTSRWMKPTSHTSNLVNSVGRPWEIYSLTASPISPVIPVYQVRGQQGNFASHVGLVPDYGVGFVILGREEKGGSVELNAYADVVAGEMVGVLEGNAVSEAGRRFAGKYVYEGGEVNGTVVVGGKRDASPGLEVETFVVGGVDIRAVIAETKAIQEKNLSFRLYPVDVGHGYKEGASMVFRASFQDEAALVDAGTPTCETWRYIDEIQVQGKSLDEFVFEMGREGAVALSVPALGVRLVKEGEGKM